MLYYLSLVLVWCMGGVGSIDSELCPSTEAFLLAMNVQLESTSYVQYHGQSLTECVGKCSQDPRCRSVTFVKNISDTHCNLLDVTMATDHVIREEHLSPEVGVYYFEKMCLRAVCERLFVIELIQGMELIGYDDKRFLNISREQCIEECLEETEFVCRSLEYDDVAAECRLSRYDRFNRHENFRKSNKSSVSYFDNTCAYKPATNSNAAEIMLLGNVEHPHSLLEYYGLTVSECGNLCLRNDLFPCRSFLFGRKSGRPYCGLTHQNRAGFLQNPGSFKPSQAVNYYELARNLAACEKDDVHLEMITGVYLEIDPYKKTTDLTPHQCLKMCRNDIMCHSVNINYRTRTCHFNADGLNRESEKNLKENKHFYFFEKICLPGNGCRRDWAFERVRGKELVDTDQQKVTVEANTREECEVACLQSRSFACRSAEFNHQLSECRISPHNRFSSSEEGVSLSSARFVVDYLENNCIKEPRGFCNLKVHRQQMALVADNIKFAMSIDECQQQCFHNEEFVCRTFSYDPLAHACAMSHHTLQTPPDGTFARSSTNDLVEISTCFDVFVNCEPNMMKVKVVTNSFFNGKIYAKEKPKSCVLDVSQSLVFTLPILLAGSDCGTVNEEEGKFSNVLVIQSNDYVVTSQDKAVGVQCSYDVGNKTGETQINVTNIESTDFSRGRPPLPKLLLRILDMQGEERNSVTLGELLRVQVKMSEEDTYGIFLRNLVAKDGSGTNNITLIDKTGCPVEVKMMREVRKLDKNSKSLESYLEAFTFTGSSVLELEADVETCLENCQPALCNIPTGRSEDDLETVYSFGRKKRDIRESNNGKVLSTMKLAKSLAVKAPDFGVGQPYYEANYATPVTAPTRTVFKEKEIDMVPPEGDIVCFEPTITAVFGSLTLFVELSILASCVAISRRWKREGPASKHIFSINYENSTDGSDITIS